MATPASCPDYEAPFAFTGHIDKVSVTVGEQGTLDKARILEAALAEQVAAHTVGGGDLRVTSPQRKTHQGRRRRPRPPSPAVVVDADGQLHAESGIITHAGEDLGGELWRWLS